jgi:hypothetical protein
MPLLASVSAMIVLSAIFITLGMRSFARRAQG